MNTSKTLFNCFLLFLFLFITTSKINADEANHQDVLSEEKYNQLVSKWKENYEVPHVITACGHYMKDPYYKKIESYKAEVLPFLYNSIKNEQDHVYRACFLLSFVKISKRRFDRTERLKELEEKGTIKFMYLKWWEFEKKNDIEKYHSFAETCENSRSSDDKDVILNKIKNLGIITMPLLVEEIAQGNERFLDILNYLINENESGEKTFTRNNSKKDILEWWISTKSKYTITLDSQGTLK